MNTNRVVWITIGVLLVAAGVAGVLANVGALPGVNRNGAVISTSMDARWRSWNGWATAAVIIVGLVVAVLGLLLLRAQFLRRGGAPMPDLIKTTTDASTHEAGRTRVTTSTLNQALTRDLLGNRSVRRAAVRLTGEKPDLRVQLAVTPDADIGELRDHVDHAVRRFSTTSGLHPDVAEVVVRMSGGQRERVH
ncbi:MAG: hypothetical protein QOE61_1512 [Micromonosporaceae bacterium]|jgi:hypothetical protein|nr:hypothetical protein [Micromonosporaceae bacterium]